MSDQKKTLILGASTNPERYSYIAAERLRRTFHPIVPVGIRKGKVQGEDILLGTPEVEDIDTVTLYVGPRNQPQYYDWLMEMKPKRIIFNPGTENPELVNLAMANDIEPVNACTLVMLGTGQY